MRLGGVDNIYPEGKLVRILETSILRLWCGDDVWTRLLFFSFSKSPMNEHFFLVLSDKQCLILFNYSV